MSLEQEYRDACHKMDMNNRGHIIEELRARVAALESERESRQNARGELPFSLFIDQLFLACPKPLIRGEIVAERLQNGYKSNEHLTTHLIEISLPAQRVYAFSQTLSKA